MKKLILTFILSISLSLSYTQEAQSYSKVISIPNISADTLYLLSKQWVISSFVTPSKVMQDDSKELKLISAKGSIEYSYGKFSYISYDGYLTYLIQIQSRDGRIKVDITNIIHENLPGNARTSNLGFITNIVDPYKKGVGKNYNNNVIRDIKEKMKIYSEIKFKDIEEYLNKKQVREEKEW